jgi:ABC-type transport system involved in multi-copper enzyme maturation permease subunit
VSPVLLIAGNFLREQRWVVLLLLALVAGNGLLFANIRHDAAEELAAFVRLQAAYGVALAVFLIAPAIHQERRSRRILSVLSKAVGRGQYLAGFLAGAGAALAIYGLALVAAAGVLFPDAGAQPGSVGLVVLLMLAAALLAAMVTLLFAIFLPPLFATLAAALLLGTPFVLAQALAAPGWLQALPVAALLMNILQWEPSAAWQPAWSALLLALPQIVVVWLAAAQLFATRDIAVAVE